MKWIFVFAFLSFNFLQAAEWSAEGRVGYYYPHSHLVRKIYSGGIEGELQGLGTFYNNWQAWVNVGYFSRRGRSLGLNDRTDIRLLPVSLGMNYTFLPCSCISPYFGLGVSYTTLTIDNHADINKNHLSKAATGLVLKSGIYADLPCNFFLDLYVDYYYQEVHLHSKYERRHIDIGGLIAGLGLGYHF